MAIALLGGRQASASDRDYSAAFDLLRDLGFPDVRGAQLVHAVVEDAPFSILEESRSGELGKRPFPNGWLLQAPTNGPSRLIDLLGRQILVSVQDAEEEGDEGKDEDEVEDEAEGNAETVYAAQWTNIPPAECAAAWTAFLSGLKGPDGAIVDLEDLPDIRMEDDQLKTLLMSSLFFAAGLHQNGLTNEASAVTEAVLAVAPDAEAYLSACIAILADTAYQRVFIRFARGGGWGDYADGIRDLRSRYGKRWADYDAMLTLEEGIRLRLEHPEQAFPAGDFPPWAATCIRQLLSDAPPGADLLEGIGGYPWVLAPPLEPGTPPETNNPIARLLDGGMESVPVLMALATNPIPVRLLPEQAGQGYGDRAADVFEKRVGEGNSHRYYSDSSGRTCPPTLGEVASLMLRPLVPRENMDPFGDGDKGDPVRDWYEANKGKSREELAFQYLAEGRSQVAMECLTRATNEADRVRLEKAILELEPVELSMSVADRYVDIAPASRAAAFRTAYIEKLKPLAQESPPAVKAADPDLFVSDPRGSRDRDSVMIKVFLKRFAKEEKKEEPSDLKTFLESLAPTNSVVRNEQFRRAIGKTDGPTAAALITNMVRRTTSPRIARELVTSLWMLNYMKMMEADRDAEAETEPEVKPGGLPPWRKASAPPRPAAKRPASSGPKSLVMPCCSLQAMGEFWRAVLAESRTNGWERIPVAAANVMETMYNKDSPNERGSGLNLRLLLGEEFDRLLIARNLARAEGRELPAMPTVQAVKAVDRAALEKTLLTVPDAEWGPALGRLEIPSLMSLTMTPPADARLAGRLSGAARRIIEAAPDAGLQPGAAFTTNDVVRLLEGLKAGRSTGSVSIVIERQPRGKGLVIRQSPGGPPSDDWWFQYRVVRELSGEMAPAESASLVYASLELPSFRNRSLESSTRGVHWVVADTPKSAPAAAAKGVDELDEVAAPRRPGGRDYNAESFWSGVEQFCAATNVPLAPAAIRIYRVPMKELKGTGEMENMEFDGYF